MGCRIFAITAWASGPVAGHVGAWNRRRVSGELAAGSGLREARSYLEFQSVGAGDSAGLMAPKEGGGFGPENFLQTQVRVLKAGRCASA